MTRCSNKVITDYRRDGTPIEYPCGTTGRHGQSVFCNECEARLEKQYPQGWRDVPGDICKHGVYVGDAYGPDYMCPWCESGCEPPVRRPIMTCKQRLQYANAVAEHLYAGCKINAKAFTKVIYKHHFDEEPMLIISHAMCTQQNPFKED